jgi:large subunit ribosomal protein L28
MSKVCDLCGKKKATGNNVSHSNRRTKRVFKPNLQPLTLTGAGQMNKKIKVCSKCIKTLGKKGR